MHYVNNYRYTITDRRGVLQSYPLNEADFQITWSRQTDGKRYYKKQLPSQMTFINDAYKNLIRLEKSVYRCEYINITVDRRCTDNNVETWIPWFTGRILLNDGTFDEDRQKIVIKMADLQDYSCFDDNKDNEINILSQVGAKHSVNLYYPGLELETKTVDQSNVIAEGGRCAGYSWDDPDNTPISQGYVPYYSQYETDFDPAHPTAPYTCRIITKWVRQKITVACGDTPPASDWILISDTCEDIAPPEFQKIYVKPASLYGCTVTYANPDTPDFNNFTWQCSIVGADNTVTVVDNGMKLADVLAVFVGTYCFPFTIKSDFFQINPYNVSDINYVTGVQTKTNNIFIFQKSDVKRPNVSGNATIANLTFDTLLTALITMFNTAWRIYFDADLGYTVFRIEHVSFWSPGLGFDLTQPQYAKNVKNLRRYNYDTPSIPASETFTWMEAKGKDFIGYPIIYDKGCVPSDNATNVTAHNLDSITTDVSLVVANPDSGSNIVSDNGFVIMACNIFEDGTIYVITESPVFGGSDENLNNSLSWAHLHRDYWRYERPIKKGNLNNQDITFLSTIPTKKGDKLTIPFKCTDTFDPDNFIKTALGLGVVDVATFSFRDQTLEVELLYNADDNLEQNTAPVANNDVVNMYQDTSVDIDVTVNDADPDPGGSLTKIVIDTPPAHGIAVVTADFKIHYTPTPGYVGNDNINYHVLDDWSEPSNTALITIIIYAANQAPVAGNIEFNAIENTELDQAAPGLFGNSSDDVSFSLMTADTASAEGGTVAVNPDGSFVYTPPVDFIGDDTFTFTIIDGDGLTDTGTVTIHVKDPNAPVANPDIFTTRKNHSRSYPALGLMANDTTGIGVLSVTAETKATDNGGSVTINADGSFSYIPPAGFVGVDTFTYTLTNGTESVDGNVSIRVFPDIYVHLAAIGPNTTFLTTNCGGVDVNKGSFTRAAQQRLLFYSDASGTTPIDVTTLGLSIFIQRAHDQSSGPGAGPGVPATSTFAVAATGTQTDFVNPDVGNNVYHTELYNCTPQRVRYEDYNYSIVADIDYSII